MGHRKPGGGQLAGGNMDQHTAIAAVVAPGGGLAAAAAGRGPGGNAVLKGDAVEMAAVVASQFGDEGGLPGGGKAAALGNSGQAAEGRVHEDRLAVWAEHQLVGIHIAGGEAGGGHIEAIAAFMELTGAEQVVEAPELAAGRHPEAFAGHKQPHRPIEEPLVQLELGGFRGLVRIRGAIGLLGRAEEDQPVGAVGGEGQREAQPLQPGA